MGIGRGGPQVSSFITDTSGGDDAVARTFTDQLWEREDNIDRRGIESLQSRGLHLGGVAVVTATGPTPSPSGPGHPAVERSVEPWRPAAGLTSAAPTASVRSHVAKGLRARD
jgi:hypothetical protein